MYIYKDITEEDTFIIYNDTWIDLHKILITTIQSINNLSYVYESIY